MEVGRRPNGKCDSEIKFSFIWGYSSAGRAPALQAGGHLFGYNPKYDASGRLLKKVSYLQQGFRNEIAPPGQTLPKIHEGGGV